MSYEVPRRICLDKMSPAELAIREAMLAVEALPPDLRLTAAVVLLDQAKEKVADYVDGAVGSPKQVQTLRKRPKRQYLVYGLTDPRTNAVKYVGKSSVGMKRPRSHAYSEEMGKDSPKSNWTKTLCSAGLSYGIEVLEECADARSVAISEKDWIDSLTRAGASLFNRTSGRKWTKEQRERTMASRAISPEVKDFHRRNAENFKRIGLEAAKKNIGKAVPQEVRRKMAAGHGRAPFQDELGNVFYTAQEAANRWAINRPMVSYALAGKIKQVKGHVFTYIQNTSTPDPDAEVLSKAMPCSS